ncbi:MAG: glucose-6-phosphate isomerase [Alphaproteobacteria bacterium]|nr:glucose-6-phosphate isomerase [Alphaproteobacteria bacterium]
MVYRQTIQSCFSPSSGGLSDASYAPFLDAAEIAVGDLRAAAVAGRIGFLSHLSDQDDLSAIAAVAGDLRARFREVVILGTGGSCLGGQALVRLAQAADDVHASVPRLVFVDTVDPDRLVSLLAGAGLSDRAFVAISKSGATTETVAQLLLVIDAFRDDDAAAAGNLPLTIVTAPGDNPLRRIAASFGLVVLDHPPDVGGRFSALTVSGLLPALIAGLDGGALRRGAAHVTDALMTDPPREFAPALGAAVSVALLRHRGCTQTVLMPYADRLRPLAAWWRQLWAESVGKDGQGSTPIDALGPADQHSQLQLYLDGPADKMFTLLSVEDRDADLTVPEDLTNQPDLGYLSGRSLSDILSAMCRATTETLCAHDRPVREIRMTRLDEATMGALMMHFMIETVIAAHLLNVDPFDQPAVEDGKLRARAQLAAGAGQ